MKNIRIEVPALAENIRMIESFIDNVKEEFHLDDDIYGNIMIAVTEAVNNAIKHGSGNDSKKNVSLSLSLKIQPFDSGWRIRVAVLIMSISRTLLRLKTLKSRWSGYFPDEEPADEVYFRDGGRTVELSFLHECLMAAIQFFTEKISFSSFPASQNFRLAATSCPTERLYYRLPHICLLL